MASTQLPNYLRANRKRLALSQKEVSCLLGAEGEAKVCRYERFVREPSLQTALACEAIFGKPVSELFGGLYQQIEQEVATRAKALAERKDVGKPNRKNIHRRETLTNLVARQSNNLINQ